MSSRPFFAEKCVKYKTQSSQNYHIMYNEWSVGRSRRSKLYRYQKQSACDTIVTAGSGAVRLNGLLAVIHPSSHKLLPRPALPGPRELISPPSSTSLFSFEIILNTNNFSVN